MVDDEIVLRRLRELDHRIGALDAVQAEHSASDYAADADLRARTERHLQVALQTMIDIAAHIAAQDTAVRVEEYADTLTALQELDILDRDLAARLRAAVGMRNVLVHSYVDIDHDVVWESLTRLDDLRQFASAVAAYLQP